MLVTLRGQMLNQGTFLSYYILVCCGDATSWFVDSKENNKFDLEVKGLKRIMLKFFCIIYLTLVSIIIL